MDQAFGPRSGSRGLALYGCLLVVSVSLVALPARAQETQLADDPNVDGAAAERRSAPDVDEITVTGTQSDVTDIQSESQAISAFSMEDLDRSEIINVDKLAFNVPALHIGQIGAESIITLRGIGTENASITGEPGLQFHVDGVNYPRPSAARVAFFDLEGIQVLRGPQGFEGGKNATAGAIRVITRKPHADYEATGDFQWGKFNQRRVRAAVNVPLNEYVQTRVAMFREDRDGYQRNFLLSDDDQDAFDADDFGVRGHVRLIPSGRSWWVPEALASYNFFEQEGVGPAREFQVLPFHKECEGDFGPGLQITQHPTFAACNGVQIFNPDDPFGTSKFDHMPAIDRGSAGTTNTLYANRLRNQDNKFWGWTGTLDWELPALPLLGETQLKSVTSYQVIDLASAGERDASDIDLFRGVTDTKTDTWYQELQWFGSTTERVDWQLSLLFMREESDSIGDFIFKRASTEVIDIDQAVTNKSYGAALNTEWHLLDDVTMILGGRFTKDVKRDKLDRENPGGLGTQVGSRIAICSGAGTDILNNETGRPGSDGRHDGPLPECKKRYRQLTGQLRLEWDPLERFGDWPTNSSLFYASVSNGYKSGGFAAFEFGEYEPEHIWSFAGGAKNTFWDDRVTFNLESYYYSYRDLQLVVLDGLSVRTENADAEVWGWEMEWSAEPLPGLRLGGQLSYNDATFTDYVTFDPVDANNAQKCRTVRIQPLSEFECLLTQFSGNNLSRAPEWTYTLSAEYDLFLGPYGNLTPRVQYYLQDDTWFRAFNRTPQNSGGGNCEAIGLPRSKCGGSPVNDLQEGYHHTDIKLIWTSPAERWTAEAFVLNLEDNAVYQNVLIGSAVLGNPGFAWYGPPRTYGFRVGFRY